MFAQPIHTEESNGADYSDRHNAAPLRSLVCTEQWGDALPGGLLEVVVFHIPLQ